MTGGWPIVSVVVPARNEAEDIEACLESISKQDYPVNRLEVLVVDGCSEDGTADLARRALARWGFGSSAVLSNEGATTSSNLNAGLARASGEIICRVDARTRIEPHYVRTCVEVLLERPEVAVVGGAQITVSRDPTARATGIARALNNRWSMGGSPYRRSTASGESDTVYLGAFRRSDLLEAGGWNEALVTNQDFDLNRRMAQRGLIWFDATLRSGYIPRRSLTDLSQQYRRFGRAKVSYWRHTGEPPQRRQWLLMAAVPAAAGILIAATLLLPGPMKLLPLALASATLLGVELRGSGGPAGTLAAHAWGCAAIGVVSLSWLAGVATEAVRRPVAVSDP